MGNNLAQSIISIKSGLHIMQSSSVLLKRF